MPGTAVAKMWPWEKTLVGLVEFPRHPQTAAREASLALTKDDEMDRVEVIRWCSCGLRRLL